jgi:hypothetical protein
VGAKLRAKKMPLKMLPPHLLFLRKQKIHHRVRAKEYKKIFEICIMQEGKGKIWV